MDKIFTFITTLLFSLMLLSCSNSESQSSRMSGDVTIISNAKSTNDGRVIVTGKTNLPDGTEFLVTISDEAIAYDAQDHAVVKNGEFLAGPLGADSGLLAGKYLIEILMPIPSTQIEAVQLVVGNEGQYLTGPLVKDSAWGGKVVEYSFSYSIGTDTEIERVVSEHNKLVSDIRSSIDRLLVNGRSMEQFRSSENLNDRKICGEMMRDNQAKAKALKEETDKLPIKYFNLRLASGHSYACVSCLPSALESCNEVADALNNVE